ncbi:hypothetical protein L596_028987 [Steinernema carpocapsae]|uniref:Uncharacterized protein n=1 Tax=Steinernema carpocapsae TaxID=34508 RepID=A0A4U5LTA6_STECR|nr:hypothetical protein L596_028987 [Steinernema carpocapsae]
MPTSAMSARSTRSEKSVRSSRKNRSLSVQSSVPGPYYGPQQYYGPPQLLVQQTFVNDNMCGCTAKTYSIVVAVLTVVFAVLGLIGGVFQCVVYVEHWSIPVIGIIQSVILLTAGIFAFFNVGILIYVILVSILAVADLLIGVAIIALTINLQQTDVKLAFLPRYDPLYNYMYGFGYLLLMLAELVFAFCMFKASRIVKATEPERDVRRMNPGVVYQPVYYRGVPPPTAEFPRSTETSARTQRSSHT